jgi:N utilization substance protein A
MVVSELRGEKIDIIPWNPEPARFVAKALSPARVREVYLDDDGREATVVVPDDQLALAIGKEGMNARLAHRLTGWKIDIVSDTEFAQQEADAAYAGGGEGEEGEAFSGRCSAILSNGKRCPNASLPGSKYCGVPAHQELALHEPDDEVNPIVQESEPELEALSDTAEPEPVTEDAAEFADAGDPEDDVFPSGPGDAPLDIPADPSLDDVPFDETLETGGAPLVHVEDDPDGGIPIQRVTHEELLELEGVEEGE